MIYCEAWRTPIMRANAYCYFCPDCAAREQASRGVPGKVSEWRIVQPKDYTLALLNRHCNGGCGVLLAEVAESLDNGQPDGCTCNGDPATFCAACAREQSGF